MRKFFVLLTVLSAAFTVAAENMVKNADFSSRTSAGLPHYWLVRGKADGFRPADGAMTMGKADEVIWLIQYLPEDLERGKEYEFSFTVSGRGQYRAYAEWSYFQDGKKHLRSTGGGLRNTPADNTPVRIVFTLPDNAQRPYIVFQAPKGSEVTFRDVKFTPYIRPLVANADFAQIAGNGKAVDWATRGTADQFTFAPGKVTMRSAEGKNAYLIQDLKKRLLPGATYRMTCKVSAKANSRFRCYVESSFVVSGQRSTKAFHAQWTTLEAGEKVVSYEFTMGNTAIGALLVFNIMGDAEVTVSDIKMELLNAPNPPIVVPQQPVFGGAWQGRGITADGNQVTIPRGATATRWMIELIPGKRYTITHSSRGEGKSDSDSGFYFYDTKVRFTNGKIIQIAHEDTGRLLQNKSYTFVAQTPTAILEIIPCGVDNLIIRELQLREAPPEAEVVPELTFYLQRNKIYSKLHPATVDGYLSNPHNAASAKIIFNGETYTTTKDGNLFRFTLKTAGLAVGSYEVTAELTAANGSKTTVKSEITVMPPAPTEVTVGPGRLLYVNGQPYLAIGPWALPNSHNPSVMEFAAQRGVNFLKVRFADPVKFKEFLDLAHRYGMKVCFNTGSPSDASDGAYRTWLHGVESVLTPEILAHPALLCYFLQDEPFWVGYPVAVLDRCYKEMQRIDPYRPVWINAAPRGTHADQIPFARVCDIYGVDIYPVPASSGHSHLEDKTIACVGKYALRKAEIAGDTKPIAMALQGFSWRAMSDKVESDRSVYPTAHENRFMTFDCLINESAMLGWWGTGYILVPEFYNVLYAQFDELRRLYPILIGNASRRQETRDGIEYRTYTGNGYTMIISANPTEERRTGTFTNTGFTGSVTEWATGRKLTANNGNFSDSFEPFAVHIYYQGTLPASATSAANDPARNNPFTEDVRLRVNGRIYDGNGVWIWNASGIGVRGSTAVLRKTFTVTGQTTVRIHISADDRAEIYCNGRKAGEVSDFTFMQRIDLTPFIVNGENTIEIHAADGGILPCGVLAEIHAGSQIYATGSDWLGAATVDGPFVPAGVVAKFGEEAWGRGVRFCP